MQNPPQKTAYFSVKFLSYQKINGISERRLNLSYVCGLLWFMEKPNIESDI